MKISQLRQIIREEILREIEHPENRKIEDKIKAAIGFKEPTGGPGNTYKKQLYTVEYPYRTGPFGDDIDLDYIEVMASSEEEAIKMAQAQARKASMKDKFKVVGVEDI